ncbi:LysR family transcriptional regulator [Amphritea sp. 1_MG-2023]|uniref:LysR family transcriptional regulator n=1 Tax=Amphritea sp. 1_MG-2023 TaxID=3062670 RepID=UPI0026E1B011|nr:LysR family transcriptional regulator [Amphritea sp. 1_MG-2023]MDO6564550.1 LysR family transcriptional regulator [Amphritea sp. 1_MG-2023]
MTLDQLQTLSRIVECGSLKLAADSLHKTQPALSMAIKKLEQEYGFKILNRNSYRLSLTEEGRSFYRKAQELLLNSQQLSSLGQHLGAGNEPLIRFAFDQACPYSHILQVLKQCQQQYPSTEFKISEKSRFGALDMLQHGQADLVVSPWWPTFYAAGDFDTLPIGHFRVLMVAAPELFPDGPVIHSEQLKSQVHLTLETSPFSFDSDSLMLDKGVRRWKAEDSFTVKQLLLAGLGWGYVPEHLVKDELERGELMRLTPKDVEYSVTGEVRLIRNLEDSLGPVASMIWQTFAQETSPDTAS